MTEDDVGGVHAKYLSHCERQLWLYCAGLRPERHNTAVQRGSAIAETTYKRVREIDFGPFRIDGLRADGWVDEVKSSTRWEQQHTDQAALYIHRLHSLGVDVEGVRLRYPAVRRVHEVPATAETSRHAQRIIRDVLLVASRSVPPSRLDRKACTGCAYVDYCWS